MLRQVHNPRACQDAQIYIQGLFLPSLRHLKSAFLIPPRRRWRISQATILLPKKGGQTTLSSLLESLPPSLKNSISLRSRKPTQNSPRPKKAKSVSFLINRYLIKIVAVQNLVKEVETIFNQVKI
jgi:hypothetical protein